MKPLYYILALTLFTNLITGCKAQKKSKKEFADSELYNLSKPNIIELPSELDEISGITYYPKDTSVFAIIDEDGILYKIPIKEPKNFKQWRFDKKSDFEDIVLLDSVFYVLISNGDIETIKFKGDSLVIDKSSFYGKNTDESLGDKKELSKAEKKELKNERRDEVKINEFESLFKTDSGQLILMCKECDADAKNKVSLYKYEEGIPFTEYMSFEIAPIAQKLNDEKLKVKPSAAAINPINKDIYVLCSTGTKLLIILSSKGEFKEVYKLDPIIYKQPEGIAFTPAGDLIITNEFAGEGNAELLILKNKNKNKNKVE